MFLLCKDDVIKEDATFTHNFPFMITLPNRLYTFAAFPDTYVAEYFRKVLNLNNDYRTVEIEAIERNKLKESRYLYVFYTKSDVNRLFSNKEKSRCRMKNVVEISEIRSDDE